MDSFSIPTNGYSPQTRCLMEFPWAQAVPTKQLCPRVRNKKLPGRSQSLHIHVCLLNRGKAFSPVANSVAM